MGISVVQRQSGTGAASASHAITLPSSGAVNGDVYLVVIAGASAPVFTTSSTGWTKLGQWDNSLSVGFAAFTGVVGVVGSLTISNNLFAAVSYVGIRIKGAWLDGGWSLGSAVTGNSSTHTTTSLTASLGARTYLWVVGEGSSGNATPPATAPTGFVGRTVAANGSLLAVTADRVAVAASVTPGNWGTGGAAPYSGNTFAIAELPTSRTRQLINNVSMNRTSLH